MWLVDLNYIFECDWLIDLSDNELSNNKLSDNNLASELVKNRSFLSQSQLFELFCSSRKITPLPAGLRAILSLGQKQFCRGNQNNFFVGLRFLSLLHLEVLVRCYRLKQSFMLCHNIYRTTILFDMILLYVSLYKWKQINYFLLSSLFSLIQILRLETLIFPLPSHFYFKES